MPRLFMCHQSGTDASLEVNTPLNSTSLYKWAIEELEYTSRLHDGQETERSCYVAQIGDKA